MKKSNQTLISLICLSISSNKQSQSSVCFSGQDLFKESKASPLSEGQLQQILQKAPPICHVTKERSSLPNDDVWLKSCGTEAMETSQMACCGILHVKCPWMDRWAECNSPAGLWNCLFQKWEKCNELHINTIHNYSYHINIHPASQRLLQ